MAAAYVIRAMTCEEAALAVDWAAAEGWNPGLHDLGTFHATDPDGFLVGLREGEPIAVISAVAYGSGFGFIGFYIVRPDCRGHGHGLALWRAAMARLEGRIVGLDGVLAQQANYERSGFRLSHRNARFQGEAGAVARLALENAPPVVLGAADIGRVCAYDAAFFPEPRPGFLSLWLTQPQSVALGAPLDDGRLRGYGVMRPCRSGYKIGPLFADDPQTAQTLFAALAARAEPTAPVFLDAPLCTDAAVSLAARAGMSPVFETARMYAGPAPDIALARTYGVTSFELG